MRLGVLAASAALLVAILVPVVARPGGANVVTEQKISATTGGLSGPLDASDSFGSSTVAIGDLDGDGFTDLAVGAFGDDDGDVDVGATYILFLDATNSVKAEQKISESSGGLIEDFDAGARFGSAVAAPGDLDGDGVEDLVVGAKSDLQGSLLVLFLNSNGTVKSETKIANGVGGFPSVLGSSDQFGSSATSIGDLDGDGVVDLVVGAVGDDDGGTDRGAVYVLFLNPDGTVKAEQKISSTQGGLVGPLDASDQFGVGVAGPGDLDGDGVVDLVVGAVGDDDGGIDRGAVYVLFLNPDGTVKAEQKISSTQGGLVGPLADGSNFGSSVGNAGDLDLDGTSDLVVGAYTAESGGAALVLFIDPAGMVTAEQRISNTSGGLIGPLAAGDLFGMAAAGLGDSNGDGVDDLAIGAVRDAGSAPNQGAVYVVGYTPPRVVAVNSTGDGGDLVAGDGTCSTGGFNSAGDQACTLRAAIEELNASGGVIDTIRFAMPATEPGYQGPGHWTIQPTTPLPTIAQPVDIDGTTQPGSSPNTVPAPGPLDTVVTVELDGSVAGGTGLTLTQPTTVRGLAINRWLVGVDVDEASNSVIAGNFFGSDIVGSATPGYANTSIGLRVQPDTADTTIGGTDPADRNLFAAAGADQLHLRATSTKPTSHTQVIGNVFGVDVSTSNSAGTIVDGIDGDSGLVDTIIADNIFAGIGDDGLDMGGVLRTTITGNLFGVDSALNPLPNGGHGIVLKVGSSDNTVGGTGPGDGNVIAYNMSGVRVDSGTGNTILGNSIYANSALGIELAPVGATPNDPGDVDTGANNIQNYPVVSEAFTDGSVLAVSGLLDSTANHTFRVEVFTDSGSQGQTFLGATEVVTPDSGIVTFVTVLDAPVPVGANITTTATDMVTGDTSEFSPPVVVTGSLVVDTTDDLVDGDTSSVAALIVDRGLDGFISLREAVVATNNTVGHDGVYVPAGTYSLTLAGAGENAAATGDLDLTDTLTLFGDPTGATVIDGLATDRVFEADGAAGQVYLSELTVTGGRAIAGEDGGGLFANAPITISRSTFTANATESGRSGGAIRANSVLSLSESAITANQADDAGGLYAAGDAMIWNTTFSGNNARWASAMRLVGATNRLDVVNTTIDGNTSTDGAGAVHVVSDASLSFVTITDNTATAFAAGLTVGSGSPSVEVANSILADNVSTGSAADVDGTVTSGGYNLIGDTTGSSGWVGTDQLNVAPILAPLADNGGFGRTRAPHQSSPAVDGADPAAIVPNDQRGVTRPAGLADVGAHEGWVPDPPVSTVVVNSTDDGVDTSPGDGMCSTGGLNSAGAPACTLRAAIEEVNASVPLDTIAFDMPVGEAGHSGGVWTITPASALPDLTAAATIDGATQPGWVANTAAWPDPFNGTQVVRVAAHPVSVGVGAVASTVRGLVMEGVVINADDTVLTGSYVGTDASGLVADPAADQVTVGTATGVVIGGSAAADRNIIGHGILGASAGGTATIQGNYVGVGADGVTGLGNPWPGIDTVSNSGTLIGGTGSTAGNLIAQNGQAGVVLSGTATVVGNRITANGGIGLDLVGDGVSVNDDGDGLLNYPDLVAVTVPPGGGLATVAYDLWLPAGDYRVEFFTNPTEGADPTGFGEGEVPVGAAFVNHPGGTVGYTTALGVGLGDVITALVVEDLGGGSLGETSEFSAAATVVAAAAPVTDGSVRRSDLAPSAGLDVAAATVPSPSGYALAFDGVDDVLVGPPLNLGGVWGADLTMEAWVRPASMTGVDSVLVKRTAGGAPLYTLAVDGPGAQATATVRVNGAGVTVSGGALGVGSWHHLVVVWDGVELVLYVDGVEVDRAAAAGVLAVDNLTSAAVGDPDVPASGFHGDIDHVGVGHRVMSAAEVMARRLAVVDPAALIHVGAQQDSVPGSWGVSGVQSHGGSFAASAPSTSAGAASWLVADGIDEPGLVFDAWWWASTDTGIELSSGTRAGLVPTDQFSATAGGTGVWELSRMIGATVSVDATTAHAWPSGAWVRVQHFTDQDGTSRLVVDGVEVMTWTAQGADPASGSVALRSGLLGPGESWYVDDVLVRRLVNPEPTVSVGPVEQN